MSESLSPISERLNDHIFGKKRPDEKHDDIEGIVIE